MFKRISILLATLFALSACASGVNDAKNLEECILDGNVNGNCEVSTLTDGQPHK